jgi:hypothetical protein
LIFGIFRCFWPAAGLFGGTLRYRATAEKQYIASLLWHQAPSIPAGFFRNILHQDIPSQVLSLPLLHVHSVCSSSIGFYAVHFGYHAAASIFCEHDGNRMETGGEKV